MARKSKGEARTPTPSPELDRLLWTLARIAARIALEDQAEAEAAKRAAGKAGSAKKRPQAA
jgi:hypothetical protein